MACEHQRVLAACVNAEAAAPCVLVGWAERIPAIARADRWSESLPVRMHHQRTQRPSKRRLGRGNHVGASGLGLILQCITWPFPHELVNAVARCQVVAYVLALLGAVKLIAQPDGPKAPLHLHGVLLARVPVCFRVLLVYVINDVDASG